jgi:hypothetical protein
MNAFLNIRSSAASLHLSRVPESQRNVALESPKGEARSVAVQDLRQDYDPDPTTNIISLQMACAASSLCQFTPKQIAYLGHMELLGLETHRRQITDRLKNVGFANNFGELREAAQNVRANPQSYRAQVLFKGQVLKITENFTALEEQLRDSVAEINQSLARFRPSLEQLRRKPYIFRQSDLSQDFLNKNEMVLLKFEADLRTLETVQLDQSSMLRLMAHLKPTLDELESIIVGAEGSGSQWEQLASEVLVALDASQFEGAAR